jgi:hypothetical protein
MPLIKEERQKEYKIKDKDQLEAVLADTPNLELKIEWELNFFQKTHKIKINLYN